jgi:hypothetical protein
MCLKITIGKDGKTYYFVDDIRVRKKVGQQIEKDQKRAAELWEIVKK